MKLVEPSVYRQEDLLSLVVQETFRLCPALATGELVPIVVAGRDMETTQFGAWVTPGQELVLNIQTHQVEVHAAQDDSPKKSQTLNVSGERIAKKSTNVATVKPPVSYQQHQPPVSYQQHQRPVAYQQQHPQKPPVAYQQQQQHPVPYQQQQPTVPYQP